ncbi:flagellar assembly protein FliH [Roseateles sp. YR242]|uniref:FliH/SctL family protein n=1 Tax=Roseateles sp. YR242 TaxID=1855305 RepID=UPI0008AF172C|nr:FliH/SctL family protein [Roseateles sp. YR242]SEK93029.1 flagellar assembly protein FliH [Roseateles sp. YR242]
MKDLPFTQPAVLRDLPSPSQARTLALPRHRHAADAAVVKVPPAMPSTMSMMPTGWPSALNGASAPAPAPATAASVEAIRATILEEDHQRAREEGLREGLKDAQARIDGAIRQQVQQWQGNAEAQAEVMRQAHAAEMARLGRVIAALDDAVATRVAALEEDTIELAFAAVCRIVGERAVAGGAVADTVRQALAQLSSGTPHRVRLNPDDLVLLDNDPLRSAHPSVEWIADPAVTPGGCLLESSQGTLDTRLDRQLEQLKQVWLRAASTGRQDR